MCESYYDQFGCNFISVMQTNLYGPGNNFDLDNAHVLRSEFLQSGSVFYSKQFYCVLRKLILVNIAINEKKHDFL